ncbi:MULTISPECIES: hypothetical protein [unclassified Clostridium]|uniref:hypothetical protein n=1 Tax=unclassified Clostridium TaxID=2614128 RepID=UPI0025C23FC3|nr:MULTISPECIES: hypothetical protein [unclassified Clostridium]
MLSEVINKSTVIITEEKKNNIIKKIESCVKNCLNQTGVEINFEDNYPLYFEGKEIEEAIFVNLEVHNRKKDKKIYMQLRNKIKKIYIEELNISEDKIFIQFDDYED